MRETTISYLKQGDIAHMDLLEEIRRGTGDQKMESSKGILLQDRRSKAYLLSTEDEEFREEALRQIWGAEVISVHQLNLVQRIQELFPYRRCLCCRQAVYGGKKPILFQSPARLQELSLAFLPALQRHYSGHADQKYLRGSLEEGVMIGAFLGEALAGFVGQHEEGSMGLLEVLPEYRGRGIGKALLAAAVNWQLERGQVPYSQIVDGNEISYRLHRSMGFSITPQVSVYWLMEPVEGKGKLEE